MCRLLLNVKDRGHHENVVHSQDDRARCDFLVVNQKKKQFTYILITMAHDDSNVKFVRHDVGIMSKFES